MSKQFIEELIEAQPRTIDQLHNIKRSLAKKFAHPLISHTTLLALYRQFLDETKAQPDDGLLKLFQRRSIRTLSGVAPITVLTKPFPCPGRCVYCPTEVKMPKSYIASEPAAQRALQNEFDPFAQVASRIDQLEKNGHAVDKIELIVLGGTWSFYPKDYQEWFIQRCFDGANGVDSKSLAEAQKINETVEHRIIGLTLETRPDWVSEEELWRMRRLGCTHVQIGVQSLDQSVLDLIKRDDTVEGVAKATALLKYFGFKFTYHIMPGLPGATPESDLRTARMLYSDERFQPDMLKIYPTVVVKSTIMYQWWKEGRYKPYDDATLRDLLVEIKKGIPPYVRINRLIRDIPGNDIVDGNLITNLRQELQKQGAKCVCIRCREARGKKVNEAEVTLVRRTYASSGGTEHFISFESKDNTTIYAFTRLFLTPKRKGALGDTTAFIRELHTYGELIPVGSKRKAVQHRGFGKRLMETAEQIAKKAGYKKLAVISGVGVKEYYRKLGYTDDNTFVSKKLD